MKQIFLRNYGAGTITMAVPAEFVKRLGLEPGDACFWNEMDEDGDEVVLRFAKAVDLARVPDLVRQLKQAAAELEPQDAE